MKKENELKEREREGGRGRRELMRGREGGEES
jgi:hypothetical protein